MESNKNKGFFNPGVTVDVVIFTIVKEKIKTLLIKRENEPFKNFPALPGGFVRKGETTINAARRVLKDKAGVSNVYVEQLYTFDSLNRDPRGQILSVSYFALVPFENIRVDVESATEHPEFTYVKSLPELAFDHKDIVAYATKRLEDKIKYTNIIYSLLPKYFTLSQLQKTYETILGNKMDKRNFRKKFHELKLVKPSKKKLTGTRQRPAVLYYFSDKKPKELEKFFVGS
jgi:8-oxo-dGTP diphosphatase